MADADYIEREHIEATADGTYKITTHIKIQNKTVITNPDIERRKTLPKFGDCKNLSKGDIEGSINIEDKEVFLQKSSQVRAEENITKFNLNRAHKEKLDALTRRERAIMSGETEEQKTRRPIVTEREEFSVKVSNLPDNIDQDVLQNLFGTAGRVRKVFIPRGRDDNLPRDFAFVHFDTKAEAEKAIKQFKDYPLGHHILSVEMADRRNQRRNVPMSNRRGRK
ncbi:unnamed protein product [Blepharisma stoltei]|uniref:RRM domain-containing protein n=1 Tax=Blepharisma stoltei TaxID=1481888 RepID=A0AAU9IZK8_9CILI|nr:unnamed protein product [Blepharisma stoltei]